MSKRQVKLGFAIFMVWFLVGGFFTLLATKIYSQRAAIVFHDTPTNVIPVCSGGILSLARTFEFKRDLNLSITQSLVKRGDDETTKTVSTATFEVQRKKGILSQQRDIYIPFGLEHGNWELHTYVTSHEFPFWSNSFEAPVVKLNIYRTCPDVGRKY